MTHPSAPRPIFWSAVRDYWSGRTHQSVRQGRAGTPDRGERGAVTGGRHMDGFALAIQRRLEAVGVLPSEVFRRGQGRIELPGFFRATKQWDLLVIRDAVLLAVIELKSQVGPSFGNNYNNRAEEAVGSAEDFWTAFRERSFGASTSPWLGFLFFLEDHTASRQPVSTGRPHFPVRPEYMGVSYLRRYELLCEKLILERKYSAACFIVGSRSSAAGKTNYGEPAPALAAEPFLQSLERSVRPS